MGESGRNTQAVGAFENCMARCDAAMQRGARAAGRVEARTDFIGPNFWLSHRAVCLVRCVLR